MGGHELAPPTVQNIRKIQQLCGSISSLVNNVNKQEPSLGSNLVSLLYNKGILFRRDDGFSLASPSEKLKKP